MFDMGRLAATMGAMAPLCRDKAGIGIVSDFGRVPPQLSWATHHPLNSLIHDRVPRYRHENVATLAAARSASSNVAPLCVA